MVREMVRYNRDDRIRLYAPLHQFLNLLGEDVQQKIREGKFDFLITDSPPLSKEKYNSIWNKELKDPVERLLIIALTAKKLVEDSAIDERDVLFSFSKLCLYLFPDLEEETNIERFTQSDLEEVEEFIEKFKHNLPQYVPRFDTILTVLLKIEYYINSLLYMAQSMNESRFPHGRAFYDFLSLMIRLFYSTLKPMEKSKKSLVKKMCSVLSIHFSYNSLIYLLEHYPEQAGEVIYLINVTNALNINTVEKTLLKEYIEHTILVNKNDLMKFIEILKL